MRMAWTAAQDRLLNKISRFHRQLREQLLVGAPAPPPAPPP